LQSPLSPSWKRFQAENKEIDNFHKVSDHAYI
jgi:hypothetical protein